MRNKKMPWVAWVVISVILAWGLWGLACCLRVLGFNDYGLVIIGCIVVGMMIAGYIGENSV